jgi:hypothetical protein
MGSLSLIPVAASGAWWLEADERDALRLVSTLMKVVENARLQIVGTLPLADPLTDELDNFAGSKTLANRDPYESAARWREGSHDDRALASGLQSSSPERLLGQYDESPCPATICHR